MDLDGQVDRGPGEHLIDPGTSFRFGPEGTGTGTVADIGACLRLGPTDLPEERPIDPRVSPDRRTKEHHPTFAQWGSAGKRPGKFR